jgi:hypothetical protein
VEIGEPEVQGEDEGPTDKGGEPEVQGGDDLTTKDDETESEDQPEPTDPRKGVQSGLDIANTTQQTLPPAFKIKIIFDAIKPNPANIVALPVEREYQNFCEDWDMGVYVQGKLVRLNDINEPLKICGDRVVQLKNAEVTVEIPGESVESAKDYLPLSIFSVGSELNNCDPTPLPSDLPEIRKILADKSSNVKETIRKIQSETGNGCIQKKVTVDFFTKICYTLEGGITKCIPPKCITWGGQTQCENIYRNETLANLNYVFYSPGYGKVVSADTVGNPERIQIDTCKYYPAMYERTRHFCLFYTIECPLCAAVRVH